MKKIAVVGHHGKLGSLLVQKPNFVTLPCDVTDVNDVDFMLTQLGKLYDIDLIINCAAISSIPECEENYDHAIAVNVRGLDNLHKVFGERVLNISSDYVFSGSLVDGELPTEKTDPDPINAYGFTKMGAETVSIANEGKTLRLSRTVSWEDNDIHVSTIFPVYYPDFFYRNYIHREFMVDGIAYFATHYDTMPSLVNYAGTDNVSMWDFMVRMVGELGGDVDKVLKKKEYDPNPPRLLHGGFSVELAKSLGFPMYSLDDTVSKLVETWQ